MKEPRDLEDLFSFKSLSIGVQGLKFTRKRYQLRFRVDVHLRPRGQR